MEEQIAVLGGGALGMLLSAGLALSGQSVQLWTRTAAQARLIGERGVLLKTLSPSPASRHAAIVRAIPFAEARRGDASLVLAAVKQTALTEEMMGRMAQTLDKDATLVLFQNGIGHMERLAAALPGRALLAAVTTEGALRTGDAAVAHTGRGETWIGAWPGAAESDRNIAAERVKQLLDKAGFSVFLSNDIRKRMLRKLLMNAVINPLTALWRVPNGELASAADRVAAMEALFRETAHILRLYGGLQEDSDAQLWDAVLEVCAATAANRSSMLQDVLAGRLTEIDAMNGEIRRIAASLGVPSPWNDAVTMLVKAIQ